MSERPRGGPRDPDDGFEGPDYDWLYGGSRAGADDPGPADPDPTRVMPAPGRGPSRREPPPSRPPAGRPPRGGPPRRRRRWGRIVLTLIVLWVVFLIAVPLWAWSRVDKVDASPSGARPPDQPGTTYLLVGSDSREGLTRAQNRKLGTGGVSKSGGRTDTIMILHTGRGPSLLLSIPRDSLVPIPGHGTTKINAAFAYGGPRLLVKTVEQDTGLRIDDYVEVGIGGFVNVVDAIGGITICPKHNVNDRRANLHVKKGCQDADGATALGWSRSRHAFPQYGDIRRAQHQRAVVNAIGDGVKSPWTFILPWRYVGVADAAATSLKVSKGTSPMSLAGFAWAMTRVNGKSGLTCSMPIRDLAVHWDRDRALELLRYIKNDDTDDIPRRLCTKTGLPPR